jgi:hypothetical protein
MQLNFPTAFLDNLPAYNLHSGVDRMLDLSRLVIDSDNYYWSGVAFPNRDNTAFGPGATFAGNVAIQPYSYITSLTVFSDQVEGFKLRIYEKGSKSDIFGGQFCFDTICGSVMEAVFPGATPADTPFGPHFLISPFIVLPPGSLQIEITNLNQVVDGAVIQIMLSCAVPVTDKSLNIVDVRG